MAAYGAWEFLLNYAPKDAAPSAEKPSPKRARNEAMSKLLVKPKGKSGLVSHVTPDSAGWTYVGFDLHRLKPGETVSADTGDREVCLVFVTGKGKAAAGGEELGSLGGRTSPFEGKPAASISRRARTGR